MQYVIIGIFLALLFGGLTVAAQRTIPYEAEFTDVARRKKVSKRLLLAFASHESRFDAQAVNTEEAADRRYGRNVDSIGLMQILWPDTANRFRPGIPREALFDPVVNLEIGAENILDNFKRFTKTDEDGFPWEMVSGYNAGKPRFGPDGKLKNQKYVDAVKAEWRAFSDVA